MYRASREMLLARLREVESRASTSQQAAETTGQELQELQERHRADCETSAKELSDAQQDFQQALKGTLSA